MRLGLQLLNTSAALNSYSIVPFIRIAQGESLNLYFQLIDLDQNGLRYVPPAGSTVQVSISRLPVVSAGASNTRLITDYSVNRAAAKAFSGDDSIWYIPLASSDTVDFISNSVKVVVTEVSPANTRIAWLNAAIKVIDGQDE